MRTRSLILPAVGIALLVMATMGANADAFQEEPPPSLPDDALCALIDGSEPFLLRDYWNSCLDAQTGTYITDYQWTADSTDGYDPFDGSEQRGECPDFYNPCYDNEYYKQGGFGDESSVWLWTHREAGADGYSVAFRRDRFWVVVGDPAFLIPEVMSLDEAEAHAEVVDSRLRNWLAASSSGFAPDAGDDVENPGTASGSALVVPDSPTPAPADATATTASPSTTEPTDEDASGMPSTPVIVGGAVALAGAAWFVMNAATPAAAAPVSAGPDSATNGGSSPDASSRRPAVSPPAQSAPAPGASADQQWWKDEL